MTDDQQIGFVEAAHRIARAGLLRYSSGNLSARIDDRYVAISATRSWLGELRADQIAIYDSQSGEYTNGVAGSVESGIHFGVLRNRADMNVVLHFQSPAATALCCTEDPGSVNYFVIPEMPYYIGAPGFVGWHMPGSSELADAVVAHMECPAQNLVGRLGLGSLKSVIRRCSLLVCNDAGARHVAVAFGVPSIVLFGPTSLEKTNLNLEQVTALETDVGCRPCYARECPIDHRCMTGLPVESVVAAARAALASAREQRA